MRRAYTDVFYWTKLTEVSRQLVLFRRQPIMWHLAKQEQIDRRRQNLLHDDRVLHGFYVQCKTLQYQLTALLVMATSWHAAMLHDWAHRWLLYSLSIEYALYGYIDNLERDVDWYNRLSYRMQSRTRRFIRRYQLTGKTPYDERVKELRAKLGI